MAKPTKIQRVQRRTKEKDQMVQLPRESKGVNRRHHSPESQGRRDGSLSGMEGQGRYDGRYPKGGPVKMDRMESVRDSGDSGRKADSGRIPTQQQGKAKVSMHETRGREAATETKKSGRNGGSEME
ncbi:unnamed protein product [Linum trigynum]|uniref:Uncharacterized protein n=1 Tax=Linum trigynum TaxID=586398 RepID=A0AAV2E0I1_9ROSI